VPIIVYANQIEYNHTSGIDLLIAEIYM